MLGSRNSCLSRQQKSAKNHVQSLGFQSEARVKNGTIAWMLLAMSLWQLCLGQTTLPSNCTKQYNSSNLPKQCSSADKVCDFTEGLSDLVVLANATSQDFIFCISLEDYILNIGGAQDQTPDIFSNSIYIEANEINFGINYSLTNSYKMVFKVNTLEMQKSFLSGELVWIEAVESVVIQNSKIQNISYVETECNCADQTNSVCDVNEWTLNFPKLYSPNQNYKSDIFNLSYFYEKIDFQNITVNSIIILSNFSINIFNSFVESSVIGIFSPNVTVNQTELTTTGNGYPSSKGFGCGYFDNILNQLLGCTGSGGSFGGFGGNSWPDNCNLMISRTPYNSGQYPSIPGSGGGFFLSNIREASSGGGVVNIQGEYFQFWGSSITANGKAGTQGGGGGSGGSIALDYVNIYGNSQIQANGGAGKSSGGGGRLWLYNHNWRDQTYEEDLQNFSIQSVKGKDCLGSLSCGEDGSILTSQCQPGYQLNKLNFICQNCPLGSYQSVYGFNQCNQCGNKPSNSHYLPASSSQKYSDACKFQCDEGYIEVDSVCYTNFIVIINYVGGINSLISIGIVVAVLIGYLIVLLFQKLTENNLFKGRQEDQYERKMHFKVQDIPFHQKRIYFSGENSPSKPWFVPNYTLESFREHALAPISKLDGLLLKISQEINDIGKFSKQQKVLLMILKVYQYPMFRLLRDYFRWKKSQKVERFIIQANKVATLMITVQKIPESQMLGIKFHVQPYRSIGCLQIFNYSKSALDFYIKNYFPIYFQLEKLPLGGYAIDLGDPFMKAFILQIDQKSESKIYERYMIELDELLRNTKQLVPILKHLWMMTEYNSNIQVYLYQPQGQIIGVDKTYSINSKVPLFLVFASETINKHHFISETQMQNIHHHKVDYFKHQYNFRQEVIQDDKKSVFWEIENSINEKVLSWSLGILTIILLLEFVVGFFIVIFIAAQMEVHFDYGIAMYFVVSPFNEFFMVALSFNLILTKREKVISHALYFTLGNFIKFLILLILGLMENIHTDFDNALVAAILYIWLLSLICNTLAFVLILLLHPHYSRHQALVDKYD